VGAWGFGVTSDDTVADIVSFFKERLKAGDSLAVASRRSSSEFAEIENDEDEGPIFWMAIAHMQWKYGAVTQEVMLRVRSDIAADRGLDRYRDNADSLAKRKAALQKFLIQLESPNLKPSALPKRIAKVAPFRQGDCLSVLLPENKYTAALVLQEDNTNLELGKNLVIGLNYYEEQAPTLADFERREWLVLSHGNWNNQLDICWYLPVRFQKERKRIALVGNIVIKQDDPKDSLLHGGWNTLGIRIQACRDAATKTQSSVKS
jgi:hypothetical protein